jgi:hypothetical protein
MRNEEAARLEGRDLVTEMSRRVQEELTDAKRDLRTVRDAARGLDPATLRILRENAGFGAAV